MQKIFTFRGKDNGQTALLTIEMSLTDGNKPRFSVSGTLAKRKGGNPYAAGQILDFLNEFTLNQPINMEECSLLATIERLWEAYHLNDMHAGTVKQEDYLTECRKNENFYSFENPSFCRHISRYEIDCDALAKANLLEDDGYRYGTSWLYREIPAEDLLVIRELLS